MNNFKSYVLEMGMPAPAPAADPAAMPPPPADPAAAGAPPPPAPAPGAPPPAQPPAPEKELPINGAKLINAIDLMDPERVIRYIKSIQTGIVNLQADEDDITDKVSNDKYEPQKDNNPKMITTKDMINRYLFLRKIAAAAADVIKTLNSERIQNAQIENMPDLNAEAKPKPSPPPPAAPQGAPQV